MLKKLLFVSLCLPGLLFAQFERPGSSGAQFLKIGVSARGTGMGDAYISVVEGAEATYYNPAALARVQGLDFAVTHTEWFAGINHEFAAGAYTIGNLGTIGLSVTALYTDEMKVRTPLQPDGTGETFFSSNYRAGFTFSRYLTDKVTFGGTINYIFLDLFTDFTASAVAGDIAVLYTTNFRDFKFGMRFSNFGSEIKFVNESYPLPTNFTFGLSMNAIESPEQTLMVSISAIKLNDEEPLGQVGAEWNWNQIIYLRGGYQLNHEVAKYSFGGGLKMNVSNYGLGFDYSLSDFELLGFTHRFGLSIDL